MPNLITTDNNCGKTLGVILPPANNNPAEKPDYQSLYDTLTVAANVQLNDIVSKNKNLLIFPANLGENEDEIGKLSIFGLSGSRENAGNTKITTGNLMGFVGIRPKGQNNEDKNVYLTNALFPHMLFTHIYFSSGFSMIWKGRPTTFS